ncbi:MAG: NUDIX hydrolase [Propionibacteriaceae bacterium]|jgi:8-oxo-dGTP diphosphatase|nr:NUDIX hydrolase [Propionibacteriaceae bacterium]
MGPESVGAEPAGGGPPRRAGSEAAERPTSIWAAGAVVWRRSGREPEVALVHRPRYDDWSLPKGKARRHEALPVTAVREVAEETGLRIRLGPALGSVGYQTADGPKRVSYWLGQLLGPGPADRPAGGRSLGPPSQPVDQSGGEVDQVAWLPRTEAWERLTYTDERAVLDQSAAWGETTAWLIVRPARGQASWVGAATDRPLSKRGREQLPDLDRLLWAYGVTDLVADPERPCQDSLALTATRLGVTVEAASTLNDPASTAPWSAHPGGSPAPSESAESAEPAGPAGPGWTGLVGASGRPTAWCVRTKALAGLMEACAVEPRRLAPAGVLALHLDAAGRVLAHDWLDSGWTRPDH